MLEHVVKPIHSLDFFLTSKSASKTVVSMLDSLGVEPESIMYDNFGG